MNKIFENQIFSGFEIDESKKNLDEGVLAKVKGPSFFLDGYSRNGRFYPEKLWENALKDPETQTKMKRGLMFGCIGHPKDYSLDELLESGKVSHKVVDITIDKKTGEGIAEYDILDTPSGRILNTILKSGSEMYVSTRAFGGFTNETKKKDGKEYKVLDEKNFQLESIDFVIEPGFLQTNPKLVESISEDLEKLSEDKANIQCENGICSLGEDFKSIKLNEENDPDNMFEDLMDLPKEDIIDMLKNVVAENKLLSTNKIEKEEIKEVEDTDKNIDQTSQKGDLEISSKLLSNYLSFVELLVKLLRYNEEYEKYYSDLIEFLDKDDKITTTDFDNISKIIEEILKESDVEESIQVICEKLQVLTEKINNSAKEVDGNQQDESFVDFMLELLNKNDNQNETLLKQQMDINKSLKLQIEHLKYASKKLAESISTPETIKETIEVEKIVEKEVFVTPKEISEKLVKQKEIIEEKDKEVKSLVEKLAETSKSLLDTNEKLQRLEKTNETDYLKLEESIKETKMNLNRLKEENESLLERETKLSKTIKEKEEEIQFLKIESLSSTYRVDKAIVENILEKYKNEDDIIKNIKRESKKLRRNSTTVENIPEYTPNRNGNSKRNFLETLTKG